MNSLMPLTVLLVGAGLIGNASARHETTNAGPTTIVAQARDAAPGSRGEAAQSMDAAVAAALIGEIASQFGERSVEVKLDQVRMDPVNLIDIGVSGEGRLQIGADNDWLPFSFESLYDSARAEVSRPTLTLGGDGEGASQLLVPGSPMAASLHSQGEHALQREFSDQQPQLGLDRITTTPVGKRFVRADATGTASFGREGTTAVDLQALYDRQSAKWVQIGYELGSTANRDTALDMASIGR